MRSLREKAGLTQADIEHRLGLSSTFVSTIENGRHALPIDRYADYADALGVRARPFVLAALRFYHPTIAATLSPARG
ncbi:MAG: helix-turn-helix transcriptional regulator [Burkholderiales bacterium]|nr:helix-turn-helix transcriptional regulator [Burkholderiales bacterium]